MKHFILFLVTAVTFFACARPANTPSTNCVVSKYNENETFEQVDIDFFTSTGYIPMDIEAFDTTTIAGDVNFNHFMEMVELPDGSYQNCTTVEKVLDFYYKNALANNITCNSGDFVIYQNLTNAQFPPVDSFEYRVDSSVYIVRTPINSIVRSNNNSVSSTCISIQLSSTRYDIVNSQRIYNPLYDNDQYLHFTMNPTEMFQDTSCVSGSNVKQDITRFKASGGPRYGISTYGNRFNLFRNSLHIKHR